MIGIEFNSKSKNTATGSLVFKTGAEQRQGCDRMPAAAKKSVCASRAPQGQHTVEKEKQRQDRFGFIQSTSKVQETTDTISSEKKRKRKKNREKTGDTPPPKESRQQDPTSNIDEEFRSEMSESGDSAWDQIPEEDLEADIGRSKDREGNLEYLTDGDRSKGRTNAQKEGRRRLVITKSTMRTSNNHKSVSIPGDGGVYTVVLKGARAKMLQDGLQNPSMIEKLIKEMPPAVNRTKVRISLDAPSDEYRAKVTGMHGYSELLNWRPDGWEPEALSQLTKNGSRLVLCRVPIKELAAGRDETVTNPVEEGQPAFDYIKEQILAQCEVEVVKMEIMAEPSHYKNQNTMVRPGLSVRLFFQNERDKMKVLLQRRIKMPELGRRCDLEEEYEIYVGCMGCCNVNHRQQGCKKPKVCRYCGRPGHIVTACPDAKATPPKDPDCPTCTGEGIVDRNARKHQALTKNCPLYKAKKAEKANEERQRREAKATKSAPPALRQLNAATPESTAWTGSSNRDLFGGAGLASSREDFASSSSGLSMPQSEAPAWVSEMMRVNGEFLDSVKTLVTFTVNRGNSNLSHSGQKSKALNAGTDEGTAMEEELGAAGGSNPNSNQNGYDIAAIAKSLADTNAKLDEGRAQLEQNRKEFLQNTSQWAMDIKNFAEKSIREMAGIHNSFVSQTAEFRERLDRLDKLVGDKNQKGTTNKSLAAAHKNATGTPSIALFTSGQSSSASFQTMNQLSPGRIVGALPPMGQDNPNPALTTTGKSQSPDPRQPNPQSPNHLMPSQQQPKEGLSRSNNAQ